ncbi:hypothetical protein [Eremococcus coleocola]|uniref:hypothetical protein n=1 Tax=Eremococcus coleocola TaxID=88132 RepID=UPI00040D75B8|nr:hypothetical protein [Eremococcus coleocola]
MFKITNNYLNTQIDKRVVQITEQEPYLTIITAELDPMLSDGIGEKELVNAVLEKFYRDTFVGKFTNEAVDTVQKIAKESKALIDEAKGSVEAVTKEVAEIKQQLKLVVMADLSKEKLDDLIDEYPTVEVGGKVEAGKIYNVNGKLMVAIKDTSIDAENWIGDASLFAPFKSATVDVDGEETEVIADFVQPTGAHDAYAKGTKVRFEGKVYESLVDHNAYSPSAYANNWKLLEG